MDLAVERSKIYGGGGRLVRACPEAASLVFEGRHAGERAMEAWGDELRELDEHERMVVGYASVTERAYEMPHYSGSYLETIARGAFESSLASNPLVVHRIEHRGLPLATTANGTLRLREDDVGLRFAAVVNEREPDAMGLVVKLERGVANQTSFAFCDYSFEWSEDHSAVRLDNIDLSNGDVASVCYGASDWGSNEVVPAERSAEVEVVDEESALVLAELGDPEPAEVSLVARLEAVERLETDIEIAAAQSVRA